MNGLNSGYGNKTGNGYISGNKNNTGTRKIAGIEYKTGNGYVSGKLNKAGQLNAGHRNGEPKGRSRKVYLCSSAGIRVRSNGR